MLWEKKTYNLTLGTDKEITRIVSNQEIYDNNSHFVRCAIIKLLREEQEK